MWETNAYCVPPICSRKISGVHHIPFPGKRDREFPVLDKSGKFPGGREREISGNGTGSRISPGNPIPDPDFNIISCFFNFLIENKGVYSLCPIVNIACWVLIASEIFVVVFFSKLTNLKELIACWVL